MTLCSEKGERKKTSVILGRCEDDVSKEAGQDVKNNVLILELATYYISSNIKLEACMMNIVMAKLADFNYRLL